MKKAELLAKLAIFPDNMEIVIHDSQETNNINISVTEGYIVCDDEGYYSKKNGRGIFVGEPEASKKIRGKPFLDMSSPTIYHVVSLAPIRNN